MITRDEMVEALRNGMCQVTFTKKNGDQRVMLGTLDFDRIPEDKHPKSDGNADSPDGKPVNTDIVKVFDTDKSEWRSFRVDSVTDFFSTEYKKTPVV